ncbi:MAG: acetoacetyl-CoA synthase, partial [Solirubrobacterales bacterium]|nr:acetoacetyl-CoA synthase [Solirubrobacterales bacterium]
PSDDDVQATMLHRYQDWLEQTQGPFASYAELWQWSVDEIEPFWASIWDFFDVQASGRYERVLGSGSHAMPGAEWFPGARLNYAEHVFRGTDDAEVAIRWAGEGRPLTEMTWAQLRTLTARIAAGLRALGVEPGDRVVAYLPNSPHAVAAVLACASIGAVWSSCSPDFGARAVSDRFAQIEPKVLLAVDGYRYGGRDYDRRAIVGGLRAQMPSLVATVLLPYLDAGATLDGALDWDDFLGPEGARGADGEELEFAQLPFDHPLWVLYSSGTTGLPKAIVQGHGGILLEQLKHQHLHLDARAGDRVFWFTTTGWMMWNFLVGVLLTDASIVLYDGNPGTPDLGVVWELAADAGITILGASAGYLAACEKAGVVPRDGRDLSALRAVGSTGSPLAPESYDWVYDQLGPDLWLFSTSGGSDVCTAFVGGVPTLPVTRGELQARSLGARVEAFDPDGEELIGAVGELVLTEPLPSMPLSLWGDDDGSRLRDAYFDHFDGVWRHGDWIAISERGTAVISGRSDSTINRDGVRMGTSEIYRSVLGRDEIVDALVVDVDGWMPLFVVLRDGATLDDALVGAIKAHVREDCSPRHVPNAIYAVAEVPRTLSGKVLEVPVKRILQGAAPEVAASRDSLVNPAALDWFVDLARERAVSTLP